MKKVYCPGALSDLGLTLEFLSYEILENFMRNEFRISRKRSLFREISCFVKLALACESQFRMFRISRNKTFNKRNETKLQRRMNKTVLRSRSQSRWSLNYLRPESLLLFIPPVLNPSSPESLLYFISSCLHPSCPASFLYCILPIPTFLYPTCPAFLLSCIPPVMYPSVPASLLS